MVIKTLPLFLALPLLAVSCKEKPAQSQTETPAPTAAAPAADAPVVLAKQGHLLPAGAKTETESSMEIDQATLQIDAGGQQMQGKLTQSLKGRETADFLSSEKIRRTIISKKTSGVMTINGVERPIPNASDPLEGKPVLLSKNDGTWTAALEDGSSPSAELLPALERVAKRLNTESDFQTYGDTPRKIGDKWNVDPSKIGSFSEAENLTGTYAVEFVGVEDYQGTPCAVLKADIDLKGNTPGRGASSTKMRLRGDVTTHRSLKDMTDLQVQVKGMINLDGEPAVGSAIHVEGPMKFTQKVTVTLP